MSTAEIAQDAPEVIPDPAAPPDPDSPTTDALEPAPARSPLDRLPFWATSLIPADVPIAAGWWILGYDRTPGTEPSVKIHIGTDTETNRELAALIVEALNAAAACESCEARA